MIMDNNKIKSKNERIDLIDVLKMFSPGTSIRTALDDILRAKLGALIVIDKEGISSIVEGGFKINCKFTPQRLAELSKMDGATILSRDLKKILYVNTFLDPNIEITTRETGTRHKAAERTAKQFNTIVVSISERKNKVTLYFGDLKYSLEQTSEVLRRAAETLQILEKEKEIFNDLLSRLNLLEINNLVMISDVCNVLQRMETIRRVVDMVKRYLVELGKEGIIVSMRLQELTKNLNTEREMILKDYFKSRYSRADETLKGINFDFLLETSNILRILFDELHDRSISSRGIRILSKIGLLEKNTKLLLDNFKTLDKIFTLDYNSLSSVFKNEEFVKSLKQDLDNLKEKILLEKSI